MSSQTNADLIIFNIKQLLTVPHKPSGEEENDLLGLVEGAAIALSEGRIVFLGKEEEVRAQVNPSLIKLEIDAGGGVVTPCLMDCHTHLSGFPYGRADDFTARVYKDSDYANIARKGGGILTTVRETRACPEERLLSYGKRILNEFMRHGVGTIEGKSGYSLDASGELRQLKLLDQLDKSHPMSIFPTYLAHMVPPEKKEQRESYLTYIIHEILPQVLPFARGIDVFCDPIAFNREESLQILKAGTEKGLLASAHVDQTAPFQAVEALASSATSLSHLENISEEGIAQMKAQNTVGIVFPSCSFHLDLPFAPANRLLREGIDFALSTDWNPGSSPCSSLLFVAYLAAKKMKMPPAQIIRSLTLHPARALGLDQEIGHLGLGYKADLSIFQLDDWRDLITQCSNPPGVTVIKNGKTVWANDCLLK